MTYVLVNDLEHGMVLAQDIENEIGTIILSRGVTITGQIIKKLLQLDIDLVAVKKKVGSSIEARKNKESKIKEQILLKKIHSLGSSFSKTYEKARLDDNLDIRELQINIIELVREIKTNNSIIALLIYKEFDKDPIRNHAISVAVTSAIIGKYHGYSLKEMMNLTLTGLLHDIGKSRLPDTILDDKAVDSEAKTKALRLHPVIGYRFLEKHAGFQADILNGVLDHHEQFDGNGYPRGLRGKEINEFARVIYIANLYFHHMCNIIKYVEVTPLEILDKMYLEHINHIDSDIYSAFRKGLIESA